MKNSRAKNRRRDRGKEAKPLTPNNYHLNSMRLMNITHSKRMRRGEQRDRKNDPDQDPFKGGHPLAPYAAAKRMTISITPEKFLIFS